MEGHSWIAEAGDDIAETFAVSLPAASQSSAEAASASAEPPSTADGSLLSDQQAYLEDPETTALSLPAAAVLGLSHPELRRSIAAPAITPSAIVSARIGTAAPHTAAAPAVSFASYAGTSAGVTVPEVISAADAPLAPRATPGAPHEQTSAPDASGTPDVPRMEPAPAAPAPAAGGRLAAFTTRLAPTAVRLRMPFRSTGHALWLALSSTELQLVIRALSISCVSVHTAGKMVASA